MRVIEKEKGLKGVFEDLDKEYPGVTYDGDTKLLTIELGSSKVKDSEKVAENNFMVKRSLHASLKKHNLDRAHFEIEHVMLNGKHTIRVLHNKSLMSMVGVKR